MLNNLLSPEQVERFHADGFVKLPRFYDLKTEIEPIQRAIYQIIQILAQKYGPPRPAEPFHPETFDRAYYELVRYDRKIGSELYDAIKQIPAFVRLVASQKHEAIVRQLRNSDCVGVAAAGYGIRIDNPREEKYLHPWHQDYPAQFRSLDGLTFWAPLVPVIKEMGPVEFCVGSHKDGPVRVRLGDHRNAEKTSSYAMVLEDEEERVSRYPQAAPLSEPGDVIVLDFLILHASGHNNAERARWTMQTRYFNYHEPTGIRDSWQGSFASGVAIEQLHPELISKQTAK